MTTQNTNPFVLPGLGQGGDLSQNPLMASMEMMRQAWQGMAGTGALAQSSLAAPLTLEDMDRRITELRTVENWLRMNLSMLSSTIQGLEVQRATIATLKTFMTSATGGQAAHGEPSPLEVVLGIKPSGQAKAEPVPKAAAAAAPNTRAPAPDAKASASETQGSVQESPLASLDLAGAQAATQGWWNMVQKQFETLAAATTATMQGAEAVKAAAAAQGNMERGVTADSRMGKTTVKSASSPADTAADAASHGTPRRKAGSANAAARKQGRSAAKKARP